MKRSNRKTSLVKFLSIDLLLIVLSIGASFFLRYESNLSLISKVFLLDVATIFLITKIGSFYYFGLYKGIWRYTSINDLINILKASSLGSLLGLSFYALIYGFSAALEMLLEIGIETVNARLRSLIDQTAEKLVSLGCLVGPKKPYRQHILTFTPPKGDVTELFNSLTEKRFVLSLRRGRIRISPHILNTVNELDQLVDELLTLSRLQDPGARAALNDIDLNRLARERFEAAQRGDQRGLNWSFEAEDNLSLRGDARLLARLLDNLLNNAARHAQAAVALRLSQTDDGTQIEVADDGPGVPEAERATLFDPFVSVSPGGSAGLGLAICREIADLHGGTIRVTSSDLGGASFRLVVS